MSLGSLGWGLRGADQAGQAVATVLGALELHAGQFGHLMALRLRVVAEQQGSTDPTTGGAERHHLLNLLERLERTAMPCMAGLSACFTSRSAALHSGRSIRR